MNISDIEEQDQLALLGELARPLVHETGNLLNNLYLQLALIKHELSDSQQAAWMGIRRESERLAEMLREWHRFPRESSRGERIELNQSIQAVFVGLYPDDSSRPSLVLAPELLWLTGSTGQVKRLCRLLLQRAACVLENAGKKNSDLLVQTAMAGTRAVLRLSESGPPPLNLDWAEFSDTSSSRRTSLTISACRSLAERLEATFRVERNDTGRNVLVIEWAP